MSDFKMATMKSMLNLQMHNSTWFAYFLSQKHGFCVYSYILMLNESSEYINVYFILSARICYLRTNPRWPP